MNLKDTPSLNEIIETAEDVVGVDIDVLDVEFNNGNNADADYSRNHNHDSHITDLNPTNFQQSTKRRRSRNCPKFVAA